VLLSGRRRTARDYGALLEAGGLRIDRIIEIASPVQAIEASLRQSPARRLSRKGRASGMRYLRRLAPASHSEIARPRGFTEWSE
jgi:hypothetical protein